MSTRSSLYYDDESNWHLYEELADSHDNVYLAVPDMSYMIEGKLVIRIPLHIWKDMRKETLQPMERYLDMSPEEFRKEAEERVKEQRVYLERNKNSTFANLAGILCYGEPESTEEEMIENFMRFYTYRGREKDDK